MDNKKRPTLKTIASLAGVSTYTVSRSLGGFSDVSAETSMRIKKIAHSIGYTPNAHARNLSMKRTNTIGMIVPTLGPETAYSDVINSVTKAAAAKDICVQLGSCDRSVELEKEYCKMMCENRVGALIAVTVSSDVSHIKEICKNVVPIIFLGGKTGLDEDCSLSINYSHSAWLAVTHLYYLGHTDIALFLYHPENNTIAQKRSGYLRSMEKYNLQPRVYMDGHSSDTFTAGYMLTEQLILSHSLPSAIWCASDLMAFGVTEALKKNNYSIPRDVSVIGHDNLFFTSSPSISISTFNLPKEEMGLYAVDLALSFMENLDTTIEKKRFFNASLIERNSTGVFYKSL